MPSRNGFEGKACPSKPRADDCRFTTPLCLWNVTVDEVWPRVEAFAEKHLAAML
jgi:hypothetical protein